MPSEILVKIKSLVSIANFDQVVVWRYDSNFNALFLSSNFHLRYNWLANKNDNVAFKPK